MTQDEYEKAASDILNAPIGTKIAIWPGAHTSPEERDLMLVEQRRLQARMAESYEAMRHNLIQSMYADQPDAKPQSKWKFWLNRYGRRIRDSWLVLTGKASIYDEY